MSVNKFNMLQDLTTQEINNVCNAVLSESEITKRINKLYKKLNKNKCTLLNNNTIVYTHENFTTHISVSNTVHTKVNTHNKNSLYLNVYTIRNYYKQDTTPTFFYLDEVYLLRNLKRKNILK